MTKIHVFNESMKAGKEGEDELDKYFNSRYNIKDVPNDSQKAGIDRIFVCKNTGLTISVEYKTDKREAETGNVFIEIWSNKQNNTKGWAYTSQAQWLYYYLPSTKEICMIEMTKVKEMIDTWLGLYKVTQCTNKSGDSFYNSEGILIPSFIFKQECTKVIVI